MQVPDFEEQRATIATAPSQSSVELAIFDQSLPVPKQEVNGKKKDVDPNLWVAYHTSFTPEPDDIYGDDEPRLRPLY